MNLFVCLKFMLYDLFFYKFGLNILAEEISFEVFYLPVHIPGKLDLLPTAASLPAVPGPRRQPTDLHQLRVSQVEVSAEYYGPVSRCPVYIYIL